MSNDDLIDNPSARCACVLVLDTSGSMEGQAIQQLNEGFSQFIQALQDDEVAASSVELAILTAGGTVKQIQNFMTVDAMDIVPSFSAGGNTPLGGAVNMALDLLDARKEEYKSNGISYYQPWLVVISDGEPTDPSEWQVAASRASTLAGNRKLVSLPVGVAGANLDGLSQCSNRPALMLDGLRFTDFFQWLSASLSRVSASVAGESVNLPPVDWNSI